MKTRYRLGSSAIIYGPGMIHAIKARCPVIPDEDLNRLPQKKREAYNANFYHAIYLLGSTFPKIPFGHIVAIIEDKATITIEGETAVVEIDEPDPKE